MPDEESRDVERDYKSDPSLLPRVIRLRAKANRNMYDLVPEIVKQKQNREVIEALEDHRLLGLRKLDCNDWEISAQLERFGLVLPTVYLAAFNRIMHETARLEYNSHMPSERSVIRLAYERGDAESADLMFRINCQDYLAESKGSLIYFRGEHSPHPEIQKRLFVDTDLSTSDLPAVIGLVENESNPEGTIIDLNHSALGNLTGIDDDFFALFNLEEFRSARHKLGYNHYNGEGGGNMRIDRYQVTNHIHGVSKKADMLLNPPSHQRLKDLVKEFNPKGSLY